MIEMSQLCFWISTAQKLALGIEGEQYSQEKEKVMGRGLLPSGAAKRFVSHP